MAVVAFVATRVYPVLGGCDALMSTLLAQVMINKGLSHLDNGQNAVEIKRHMESAVKEVIEYLRTSVAEDISSEDQLEQIATISANNDVEIGKLIATAMEKVGRDGVVTIEESRSGETYLERNRTCDP